MRMAACGQTMAHLPQSMQIDGSQIGISWAIARFSKRVVPVGKVPSTGKALTGSWSPRPAMRTAVTFLTKSGASSGTTGGIGVPLATAPSVTLPSRSIERSMAAKLRSTMAWPRLAYVFSTKSLIRAMASCGGRTSARWKKHGCMIVLMRLPMPTSVATAKASITQRSIALSMSCCCTSRGRWSQTSSGP